VSSEWGEREECWRVEAGRKVEAKVKVERGRRMLEGGG